ncbi:MAG: bifunctional UDP-sugar hydrolase/5'-nucleotidase, partial [Polyangiaceae bacterium]
MQSCRGAGGALLRAGLLTLTLAVAGCDASGCGQAGPGTGPAGSGTAAAGEATSVQITVVGTSDLHGRLSTLPLLGGYVDVLRGKNPGGVVLVDAGDMFQGTLESNANEGEAVIAAYRKLAYDAVAIGNHEFDYGPVGPASVPVKKPKDGENNDPRGAIKARAAQAEGAFPMLSANILEDGKALSWRNVAPSVTVVKRGVSVGIIGVSTMGTPSTTIAANVQDITMKPVAKAIEDEAKALRASGVKVIVVAAHAGGACTDNDAPADLSSCEKDSEIFEVARALPAGTVQVIVAGHTHKAIAHEVNGIAIVQSNAYGTALGRVDLTVDRATGEVTRTEIHPPEPVKSGNKLEGATVWPAAAVEEVILPAVDLAAAKRAEGLNTVLSAPFPAKYREESALGNMVTSLLLEAVPGADIAVANGGGLRAELPAGELSYGALYDALPFDNRVARLWMKAPALQETTVNNHPGPRG